MARIRTIKPQFFKNEIMAEQPMTARLLFIGLLTISDVDGRLEDRPRRIKAELFPYDNLDVDKDLTRLQTAGFIERYEVDELKVIQVTNFKKHQRITGSEATSKSEYPENIAGIKKETPRKHFGNTLDDKEGNGDKERNKERNGAAQAPESDQGHKSAKGGSEQTPPPSRGAPPKNVSEISPAMVLPWDTDTFKSDWLVWKGYKYEEFSFQYKGLVSEQQAMAALAEMAEGDEKIANAILRYTIGNKWKGFVKPKADNGNGQSNYKKGQQHTGELNADHKRDLVQRVAQAAGKG